MNKLQVIEGVEITLKPIETTLEFALRGMIYRKLINAMKASKDDNLLLLAEDTEDVWRFVCIALSSKTDSLPMLTLTPTDSKEVLLGKFCDWLTVPGRISQAIWLQYKELEVDLDPTSAPPEGLDPNAG